MCNHFRSLRFCKWWTVGPKTTNIFPSLFSLHQTVPQKWLNPSRDNLALISLDVFGLTFPPVALQLLGLLSWPHTTIAFLQDLSLPTPGFNHHLFFFTGWMLHLLRGDVCFHLEIWTVELRTAHRPVIREVSDNGKGTTCCCPILLCLWVFFWSVLLIYIMGRNCFSMWG